MGKVPRKVKVLDAKKLSIKVNCMLHKTELLMKLLSWLSQPDDCMEKDHTWFKWQMHVVDLTCSEHWSGRESSTLVHVRLCDGLWNLHLITRDFTYGCTWRWCAGSWGVAACTRGFSSRGHQTWRMHLFSPCTRSPGIGQISPCCPGRKSAIRDLATNELFIEVKLLNHRCGLSWHVLYFTWTSELQNATLQCTHKTDCNVCLQWHANYTRALLLYIFLTVHRYRY